MTEPIDSRTSASELTEEEAIEIGREIWEGFCRDRPQEAAPALEHFNRMDEDERRKHYRTYGNMAYGARNHAVYRDAIDG